MKFSIAAFLILGIFAITVSIQTTHAQIDDPDRNYLDYHNEDIGMNLEYPDNWGLVDGIQNVPFVARLWAPGNTGLISMDHMYRDSRISPRRDCRITREDVGGQRQ